VRDRFVYVLENPQPLAAGDFSFKSSEMQKAEPIMTLP
jgi:hypothetical protein